MKSQKLNPSEVEILKGQISEAEVKELKEKHKELYAISGGGHIAYFRKPNRHDVNFAASTLDADTPLSYFESIMQECMVAGSSEIINNDSLFLSAMNEFKPLVEGQKTILAKL
jgi:hypothetical protein